MLSSPRSLSLLIVVVFAMVAPMAGLVAIQGQALAQSAHPLRTVTVRVNSVLAAETNEGVDPRLQSMGPRLQALFSYSTYRLVSDQAGQTQCGKMIAFQLPGGRILHVQPREVDGDMIVMEIILFQGPRPLMTTDLKLKNNGILIIGGPRYEQGMLIISIGASTGVPQIHSHQPPARATSEEAAPQD
ncbi:MAG TPA: hypothetical protein VMV13_01305 [Candidatus Binataceae bacterium]|nr:hypothetical protein [Candidatus Binataceae bacterium]